MAHQKAAALKLEMKDVVLVKPSKSTPSGILSLSTIDSRPDLDSLCQVVYVYRSAAIHDSDDSQLDDDPADVMRKALSKALFYYYPLAGRLMKQYRDGKQRVVMMIKCSSGSSAECGVPFLEATANCDLSSLHYLDGTDTEIAKHLVLHLPPPNPNSQDKSCCQLYPPVVFMVTKFLCGGFTIGIGVSHALCDGFGASQFFQAIVEFARGRSEPSVKPVWERERLEVGSSITKQVPLQNPMDDAAVSPFLPTTVVKQVCVKVDREMIRRLKLSLMKESESESETIIMKEKIRFTTFESLAACVWRSRARALKLSSNGKTMLLFLVGLRGSSNFNSLLRCPLPDGYYGNAIVDANVVVTVRELNERPLSEIVKLIKETKKVALTTDYIRNSIETKQQEDYNFELEASGAVTVLTEWKHLGFVKNMDLGGRTEAVNVVPAPCNMFGSVAMCIFSSESPAKFGVDLHPSMKGGLRIFTSLPIAAIPKFREEIIATFSLYSNTSKM